MERTEKKHGRRKRLIVSAAAVVTAVIVSIAFWPGPKEPEYEGRKLSEWLEICRYDRLPKYGNPAVPEEQLRVAVKAIRQIGTNALPLLVHWLEIDRATGGHMYRAAEKLPAKLRHQRIVSDYLTRPHKHFAAAQIGFEILGSEAFYAIPDLARLVERGTGQTSGEAVKILFHLGGPMYPTGHAALRGALANPKADRSRIVETVRDYPYFGNQTALWVSAMEPCVRDKDTILAVESVLALQAIGETHDGQHDYGSGSSYETNVVAALKKALESGDESVRLAATNALQRIAPEVLRANGVDEVHE